MMRVYEKYLARQIYLAFLFVLLAFVGLFVFFDLVSELGDVGRGGYRFQHALAYVLLFAPQRMYEIIPVASLIAAIYVCAQLAGNSEFTIFRVSGLSTGQALRSLLKIGFPIVLVTFVIGEYVAPNAEQLAQKIRLEALGSSVSSGFRSGVWVKDTVDQDGSRVTRFINVGTLNPDNTIANVRIYEFDDKLRLDSVRLAKLGQFEAPNFWKLTDVSETVFTATDKYIHDNPKVIQAWTNVVARAEKYVQDTPAATLAPQIMAYFPGMDAAAVTEAIERYKQYRIWKTSPLVTADAMNRLQDMLVASAVMKDSARVKYEDVVVADFARKVPQ